MLDPGAGLTKLLPPFVLFSNKSDFKCLAFQTGCRTALCSQTGPHRARPNATPCRGWSHEQEPGWGPQRAAPPTYTSSHQSLKINNRNDTRGHLVQGRKFVPWVWREEGFEVQWWIRPQVWNPFLHILTLSSERINGIMWAIITRWCQEYLCPEHPHKQPQIHPLKPPCFENSLLSIWISGSDSRCLIHLFLR